MRHSRQEGDITTDPEWLRESTDRLIGWELLQKVLGNSPGDMQEAELMEKIGAGRCFWYDMTRRLRNRMKDLQDRHAEKG